MGDRRTPSRYVGKAVLSSAVERFNVLTSLNLDYGGGILVSLNGDLYKDVSFISVLSNCLPGSVAFFSASICLRLSRKQSSVMKRDRFHEADTERTKMNVLVKDAIVSINKVVLLYK